MFAPKAGKLQARAAPASTNSLARSRSTLTAQRHGSVEQALLLQHNIGNQAMLRLMAQRTASPTRDESNGDYKLELVPENTTGREVSRSFSWDFSKVPIFPPGRTSRSQASSPLRGIVQPKLVVGAVNTPLEYEADRVADQVMRMPDPTLSIATKHPQISRKCTACDEEAGHTVHDPLEHEADRVADQVLRMPRPDPSITPSAQRLSRKCAACEDEAQALQPKSAVSKANPGEAPKIVHEVLASAGRPLDPGTRAFFEPRFGYDFSRVRVHADARAAESARAIGALGYTVGEHIVFGSGADAPTAASGRRLLAHELAHTIQQSQGIAPLSLQRASADPSAIPSGLTSRCVTDPSPGGAGEVSLTGVSVSKGLSPQQKKQVADFQKSWAAAGSKDFIAVEGYASPDSANDTKVQQQSNWSYSCKRAELVEAELAHLGVPRSRMIKFAHGETDQFAKGGDPDPNRRVNISRVQVTGGATGAAGQGAAGGDQAPNRLTVQGNVASNQSKVDVRQQGTTDNPLKKPPATTSNAPEGKPGEKKAADKGPPERELSITLEFDLKNDWKLDVPPSPAGTPKSPFLCGHGVYQLGLKWNRGIKLRENPQTKEATLELLNEPELDVNFGDPLCGQNASITAQVNLLKFTILKDLLEADLVGVVGLPDGWAASLQHFPFTGSAQIKLQTTPFSLISPEFKNIKIGAFGGFGFEQGVQTPAGEEPQTKIWTVGGFIGFDYDIGPKK